ncbi:ABC transporter substrate-binding protein [Oligoflexus tunisiensis]|uniref:ABC transporter substrate-binding protein n=1 Tax=Oligoflexus tunisiensis TaxID=708132 RepID=UPI000A651256|nr:ABC transporter substrate-binding protein [Oligoflexus tunisiensis]
MGLNFRFSMFVALLCGALPVQASAPLKKASFRPQWVPQAQFAGYYVAQAKGFYKEQGIDLEIRAGGPGIIALNNVAGQKDTFGTDWLLGGLTAASKGAPIVNIGQMFQTSGLMLVAFKKSGITEPKQMKDRTVGIWPGLFALLPQLLFKKYEVQPKLVSQKFSIEDFLKGQLDVASATSYNEYPLMLESVKQADLTTFHYRDFGLNIPEDGIYAHAETCKKDPALCQGFVKASIKGWLHAFDHADEAVDLIMAEAQKAKTGTTRTHQLTMLKEVKKLMLYNISPERIGELSKATFDFAQTSLKDSKQLNKPVSYESFHRPIAK